MLNLRQVEAFRAMMITGSVTKASEIMHITQPAVSRLIADFERSVGLSLFDREKRRLNPTKECLALYREVEKTYAGLEHVEYAAEAIRNMQLGQLSVVTMPIASNHFLPDVIAEFTDTWPDISVSLWTWPRDQAIDWILSQQYDLGLLTLPIDDTALAVEPFAEEEAVCLLPADHVLTKKKIIKASDLDGVNFLPLTPGGDFRLAVNEVFRRAKIKPRIRVEARSAATVCGLVANGSGVSLLGPMATYGLDPKQIVTRPFRPRIPFQAGIVYPAQRSISKPARAFADLAARKYRERPGR
jgi:DNA-binding transcriptional LysR family regulator